MREGLKTATLQARKPRRTPGSGGIGRLDDVSHFRDHGSAGRFVKDFFARVLAPDLYF
jgi:hypothetical protein